MSYVINKWKTACKGGEIFLAEKKGQVSAIQYAITGFVIVAIILSGVSLMTIMNLSGKVDDLSETVETIKTGEPSENQPVQREPINISVFVPLTGPVPAVGEDMRRAVIAWKNQNEEIMGRPYRIKVRDSGANPEQFMSAYEEEKDRSDFMAGLVSSACGLSVLPKLAEDHIVFSVAHSQTHKITGERFPESDGFIFRPFSPNTIIDGAIVGKIMGEKYPEMESATWIGPDYAWGHDCWKGLKRYFEEEMPQVETLEPSFPSFGARDYSTYISVIQEKNPDVIGGNLYADDLVSFVRQAKGYGFFEEIPYIGMQAYTEPAILKDDTPNQNFYGWPFHWYMENPENQVAQEINEFYQSNYNKYIGSFGQSLYGALSSIKAGIEEAESTDPEDVKLAMENLEFDTPWGSSWIRPIDHQGFYESIGGLITWSSEEERPVLSERIQIDTYDFARTPEEIEETRE